MNPETECSLIEQRDYIIEEEEDWINGEKKNGGKEEQSGSEEM